MQTRNRPWSSDSSSSGERIRILAVASLELTDQSTANRDDDRSFSFLGFLIILDHTKANVTGAIADKIAAS